MESSSGSITNTSTDIKSEVLTHLHRITDVRKQMSSECLKLVEKNMQQELVNAEKTIILKPKQDTEQLMTQLNKPLSSYFQEKDENVNVTNLLSKLKEVKEKNDDLLKISKMLPKGAFTKQ